MLLNNQGAPRSPSSGSTGNGHTGGDAGAAGYVHEACKNRAGGCLHEAKHPCAIAGGLQTMVADTISGEDLVGASLSSMQCKLAKENGYSTSLQGARFFAWSKQQRELQQLRGRQKNSEPGGPHDSEDDTPTPRLHATNVQKEYANFVKTKWSELKSKRLSMIFKEPSVSNIQHAQKQYVIISKQYTQLENKIRKPCRITLALCGGSQRHGLKLIGFRLNYMLLV